MTLVRKMIIATGSLASVACMAQAQYAFPAFTQTGSGTIGTTWQEFNLGPAPAGTYTSYLVVMDWTGPNTTTNQWSNEVDISMGANSTGALGTANTGPSTSFVSPRYVVNAASAIGSAGNVNPVNNMYWTGNFTTNYTGGTNLSFYSHQSFAAAGNASHNNVRVILNPVNTSSAPTNVNSVTGVAAPASFTNLGTIDTGIGSYVYNSGAVTTSAANPLQWFSFTLAYGGTLPGFLLDLDTENNANSSGTMDSQINLFYQNSSGQLIAYSADDDDGSGLRSQLSYGNTSPTANGRPYTAAAGGVAYNGRDSAFTMPAGTYFFSLGFYNADITGLPTAVNSVGATGLHSAWQFNNTTLGTTTTYGTTQVNINFVPTPGTAGLMGLGMLAAARRRRV